MKPAGFTARYLAYSLDLMLLLPIGLIAGWSTLQRIPRAIDAMQDAATLALDRAFAAGHINLLSLAEALRHDADFLAALSAPAIDLRAALLQLGALTLVLMLGWFAGFEASRWQATPGKRLLGLRVETVSAGRPSVARTLVRFVAGAPSWLLLHVGHAMAGWRDDGRALHDLIAGTRVQGPEAEALPAWARALLALQLALLGVVLLRAAWRIAQAVWLLGI